MVKKYYKLILIFIFGLFLFVPRETHALTVYAERFNDEQFLIMSNDQTYWRVLTSNFNNTWANAGSGYIRFQFSMQKAFGTSTNQVLNPMSVTVGNTLGNEFPCDIGSISVNNSTYNNQIYSAICPVNFYNGAGLKQIVINFDTNTTTNDPSGYYVNLDGRISFEVPQFIQDNSQAIINSQSQILAEQQQTTQAIDDLNDNITSPDIDEQDTEDNIDDFMNDNDVSSPTDVGIQDLITLPIKLLTGLLSSLNSSCNSITLVLLGNNIVFPCINLADYLGAAWNIIDIIISCVLVYKFAKKLKEIFIDFTSLDTNKGDLIE